MKNPLNHKATWIILPLLLWAAVAGAFYKFFHPLTAREMNLIAEFGKAANLPTVEDRERFYTAQGPIYVNLTGTNFQWISAAIAKYDAPRMKKSMDALQSALAPLTNKAPSDALGYLQLYGQLLTAAVLASSNSGSMDELANNLALFRIMCTNSGYLYGDRSYRDYYYALDNILESSSSTPLLSLIKHELDENNVALQKHDPALQITADYTLGEKLDNLQSAHSAAEQGARILSEAARTGSRFSTEMTPYWSAPLFNLRLIQQGMQKYPAWREYLPVSIKNCIQTGPTAPSDTALLAATFMATRENYQLHLAELNALVTSLELRRAALAIFDYSKNNNAWPSSIADLQNAGYNLDYFITAKQLAQESLSHSTDNKQKPRARAVGQPQLQQIAPGIDDIKSWVAIPQAWEWQNLAATNSSGHTQWTATIAQVEKPSGGQLQHAITAGMWVRQLQNTPGCTVTSYTVSTRDTHTPLDISDAAMKQYLDLQLSNSGNTWPDRFTTPTAELIQVHVDFQTQPQWLKLTVESPYANTPLAGSFNRALFPFILRTAPGGSSPQDNSM